MTGTVPDPVPTEPEKGQLPLVDGPNWANGQLAISREWIACRKDSKAPWNVIPFTALSSVRPVRGGIEVIRGDGAVVTIGKGVLSSPEACNLLVAGMSTNPAVGPAADELLKSHLEAARRKRAAWLARRHSLNRSGTTHTFRRHRGFGIFAAALGGGFLALGVAGLIPTAGRRACAGRPWAADIGQAGERPRLPARDRRPYLRHG